MASFLAGNNPFTRLKDYKKAEQISRNLKAVLNNFKEFTSNPQNLYELSIVRISFHDTCLLSTRFITRTNPSTEEIYRKFDLLKKNIQKQHGQITGYPIGECAYVENR